MNAADTAWILVATALVLFMTLPGLALFYGGLVRARNVLSVFMHCFAIACLMSILWLVAGYSIAFGGDGAIWGGLGKAMLMGVGPDALHGTLPEILFFAFQMTFAIITPALIVGAYVERVGFGFVLSFSALWMLICYAPVVHWIWGGGFLADGGIFGETGVKEGKPFADDARNQLWGISADTFQKDRQTTEQAAPVRGAAYRSPDHDTSARHRPLPDRTPGHIGCKL